jgi:hypothetical protein
LVACADPPGGDRYHRNRDFRAYAIGHKFMNIGLSDENDLRPAETPTGVFGSHWIEKKYSATFIIPIRFPPNRRVVEPPTQNRRPRRRKGLGT